MAVKATEGVFLDGAVVGQVIPGLAATCSLNLVNTSAQFRNLEQDWHELEAANQTPPHVFQSFDWCMAWCDSYLAGEAAKSTLQIVTGYDGNRLVFAFPLMAARRMGQNALVWLTEPFGQYGDVLCAKGQNPKLWISAALGLIKRFKDIDIVHLRHVRDGGILAQHGVAELINARVPEQAPYLDLSAFKTDAEYDTRYTSQQRKRRKKIRKGLEVKGEVSFKPLPSGTMADAAMQLALSEKTAWLAERGRINRVMSCPRHLQFLKNLSRRQGAVSVVVTELSAGDRPVSWEVGFRFGTTHFAYLTSHMNALTDLSPGRLHMDMSQRGCLAAGMTCFDLMVPNDTHKESWSSGKIDTNDYFLPVSAKGSFYGHLYLRLIRPVARDVYYWLEPRVLPWLSRKSGTQPATSSQSES